MKYTLYNVDNSRKTSVRGFWIGKGMVYKDSIRLVKYTQKDKLNEGIRALFASGQEAVFYTKGQSGYRGYCINKKGNLQVFKTRHEFKRLKLSGQEVKRILIKYGGLTIYNHKRSKGYFLLEVYSA